MHRNGGTHLTRIVVHYTPEYPPYPPHHRLHGGRGPRSHLPAQAHPGPAGPSPHRKRPCQVCGGCPEDDLIRSVLVI